MYSPSSGGAPPDRLHEIFRVQSAPCERKAVPKRLAACAEWRVPCSASRLCLQLSNPRLIG